MILIFFLFSRNGVFWMLLTKHGMRVGQNKLLVSKVELLIRIVATKKLGLVFKESLGSHSSR